VDVVVPFRGLSENLDRVVARLGRISRESVASMTVVDNREGARSASRGPVRILPAPRLASSYYARNCGAALGKAPWVLFLDADVDPPRDLVLSYFDPSPSPDVAVLAGAVRDEAPDPDGDDPVVSYAHARGYMSQDNTLHRGRWRYAQTANCAIRREAFEAVGGFVEGIRSAGDADICFRLAAAGWSIEERPNAGVIHRSRRSLRALLAQRARHGAGVAWANRQHPGSFPPRRVRRWPLLALWGLGGGVHALRHLAAGRRARALEAMIPPLNALALEAGRGRSNRAERLAASAVAEGLEPEAHTRPEHRTETPT
jgi:mycofactocin glycosyltransferase